MLMYVHISIGVHWNPRFHYETLITLFTPMKERVTIVCLCLVTQDYGRSRVAVIEQRGGADPPISHWGGELDVDDPKFPGDARNSRNQYTTAPMVTNPCFHESASPRRLALLDATRTRARTTKQQSEYY
jgi:hypothetical protein